jgi:transposase
MVKCTKRQIRQLKTALHWKMPEAQRQRIQMILLRESGMAQPAIADAMGVSLSTVNRAHMAYDHGGIKALKPKPSGGRKRENMTLTEEKTLLRRFANAAGAGQGCSTLFVVVHIAQGFEASEGSGVAILGDGVGLIEPQDIISEAPQSGEDARVAADARGIFAEGDVAGVVLFVFDTPMFANGIGGLAGTDGAIGQVERGFA